MVFTLNSNLKVVSPKPTNKTYENEEHPSSIILCWAVEEVQKPEAAKNKGASSSNIRSTNL